MGEIEIGLKQKLREKTKLGVMLVGFICSCGLYEFGGVFWMTYFNPYLQTAVGKVLDISRKLDIWVESL